MAGLHRVYCIWLCQLFANAKTGARKKLWSVTYISFVPLVVLAVTDASSKVLVQLFAKAQARLSFQYEPVHENSNNVAV